MRPLAHGGDAALARELRRHVYPLRRFEPREDRGAVGVVVGGEELRVPGAPARRVALAAGRAPDARLAALELDGAVDTVVLGGLEGDAMGSARLAPGRECNGIATA